MSIKIAGFGNSLTYGYLVNKGYLDYLKEYIIDADIINEGIPGDTAFGALQRVEHSLHRHKPDLTIVEFCVNDAFSGFSVKEFENYYIQILDKIPNNKIIMIPHKLKESIDQKIVKPFYECLRKIGNLREIPIIDISKFQLNSSQLLADGLHPNEKGYEIYAKEAFKVVNEFLK